MNNNLRLDRRTFVAGGAVATATLCLGMTGCGTSNAKSELTGQDESSSKTLAVASMNTTDTYNPINASKALACGANWHVVEGLYELDMATYEPYAALAAGDPVEVSETEYEIPLRESAAFSDSTPVTAKDVVNSYKRTVEAEGSLYQPMLSFIKDMKAKDDNTVVVELAYPFTLLKERLPLVKVVPSSITEDELNTIPVGSGPWMYQNINEQEITFVPNPYYTGPYPAAADSMRWDIIADDTARTTALQEGSVQVMESVPPDVVDQLTAAGATVEDVQSFGLAFLMFNTKKKPFNDVRVRQAFLHAIDMEKLIDNALMGKASACTSLLPASHPNYHEASMVYAYDPAKAKSLLEEAGVQNLNVVLDTTDTGYIVALAPQIKNDLEAVGVTAEVSTQPSKSLYPNRTDNNVDFDVVLAPGDPSCFGLDPDLLMNWWYGDNIWTQKRTQWKGSAEFQQLQDLMQEAAQTSGTQQQEIWNECLDLISEQVPLYPLFHRVVSTGYYANQLKDFEPIGTTSISMVGVSPAD